MNANLTTSIHLLRQCLTHLPESVIPGIRYDVSKFLSSVDPPADPPFALPPPPPGKQWHRTDGWTKDMLPTGARPLLLGESREPGDEMMNSKAWIRVNIHLEAAPVWIHHRTTRPLAFEHNGHAWNWHRPGDPMPCSPEAQVAVLVICETGLLRATDEMAKYKNWGADTSIIGWRLPEPEKKTVPLTGKWDKNAWEPCRKAMKS